MPYKSRTESMLADARNANLYRQFVEHIEDRDARDAFRYLVGLAAEDPRFDCHPQQKGVVLDFRYIDRIGEQPYSLIVNKGSLLLYFRRPALANNLGSKKLLTEKFSAVNENTRGELTVKLRSIADVQRLWDIIGPPLR